MKYKHVHILFIEISENIIKIFKNKLLIVVYIKKLKYNCLRYFYIDSIILKYI